MRYKLQLDKIEEIEWVKNQVSIDLVERHEDKKLKIVDLFCGCGGLTLGLRRAAEAMGFRLSVEFAIDHDQDSVNTFMANFSDVSENIVCKDILSYFKYRQSDKLNSSEQKLKEQLGEIDILVAGPPCQGHSDLNNHSRRDDPRNELYLSCLQAVKIARPQMVIIENVPTVIHSKEGVVKITKDKLTNMGYHLKELKVDFLQLGIPQSRNRHIIVASLDHLLVSDIDVVNKKQYDVANLMEYIGDNPKKTDDSLINRHSKISIQNQKRIDYLFTNNIFDLPDDLRPNCHKNKKHSYKSSYGRLNPLKPAQTITSGFGSMGQGRYVHPILRRTLIPREAARIQGFPDYFKWRANSLTSLRKLIANAVPPQLTYKLGQFYIDRVVALSN